MIEVPDAIIEKVEDLQKLVTSQPDFIRNADAAKFIGMTPETYRIAALRGALPWAVGLRRNSRSNSFCKTMTLPFYLHMMNLNGIEILKEVNK